MAQEIKKINRSIKIYPLFASFTGDLIFFVPIDTFIFNIGKRIKCKSDNINDKGFINNMYSVSKSNISYNKKDRKCKFLKIRINYVIGCIINTNIC